MDFATYDRKISATRGLLELLSEDDDPDQRAQTLSVAIILLTDAREALFARTDRPYASNHPSRRCCACGNAHPADAECFGPASDLAGW